MSVYTGNCSRSTVAALTEALSEAFRLWIGNQLLKYRLHQERQQLQQMSDSMLQDIGISRNEALTEARRNDIPAQRKLTIN